MSNEKQLSEKGEGLVVCESTSHIVAFPDDPHKEAPDCINPRAAPSASPALVEGERQEMPCDHGRASWQMCPHCMGFNQRPMDGELPTFTISYAPAPSEPRAAPLISLEEQAQPDAQDLTEEELDRLEWAVRHAVQPSVSELVPRLLTEVKRRRGIK